MKQLPDSQRTRENAVLKIDDGRLFDYFISRVFEGLVGWVVVDIVIPVFNRVELHDKSMSDTMLDKVSNVCLVEGTGPSTWRFSVEISLPPATDTMYGLAVLGWIQALLSPKKRDVICKQLDLVVYTGRRVEPLSSPL